MSWIIKIVLDWLLAKAVAFFTALILKVKRHKEIDKQSEESVKPLEKAETAGEIDKAADDALNGF